MSAYLCTRMYIYACGQSQRNRTPVWHPLCLLTKDQILKLLVKNPTNSERTKKPPKRVAACSILIGDPLERMLCQLVSVEIRVELNDLIYGSVEWYALHHSIEHVMYRLNVLFRQPIVVEDECWIAVKDGLADFLLVVSVGWSAFGHSNPPI